MGTRRGWPVLADPGPADHHPLPAAGQPACRPAAVHVPEPGAGPDQADHPDGPGRVPADRIVRRAGGRPAARRPGARTPAARGPRAAAVRRYHPGRAAPPRPPADARAWPGHGGADHRRARRARRRPPIPGAPGVLSCRRADGGQGGRAPGQDAAPRGDGARLPKSRVRRGRPGGTQSPPVPHPAGERVPGAADRPRGGEPQPGRVPDHAEDLRLPGTRAAAGEACPAAARRPRHGERAADRAARIAAQRDHRDGSRALAGHDPDRRRPGVRRGVRLR